MNQSSLQDDAPVDEIDEQLVAYLDGELPPEEVKLLEQQLGANESLRARLRELQNGWDLLDDLPHASSSNQLLETTIRMAAVDGGPAKVVSTTKPTRSQITRFILLIALTAACYVIGLSAVRLRGYLEYRKQLRDLPLAMHLDAFLRSTDLEMMEALAGWEQWQQANQIADRLGQWDFSLAEQIDEATPKEREKLLPTLSIENQQTVSAAWERFERVDEPQKQRIYELSEKVAKHPQSKELLETMDRFAAWFETLSVDERDKLATGTNEEREETVRVALERTTKQWTRQRGRELSDEEVDTIYHAVRQIARLRLKQIQQTASAEVAATIRNFGSSNQSMNPQFEAFFLRRLFEDRENGPQGPPSPPGSPSGSGAPQAPAPGSFGPPFIPGGDSASFQVMRAVMESIRGPLQNHELYMIESVLPNKLADDIESTAGVPTLREELLRSLADESLRRIQFNRSGMTWVERYQARSPSDREQIDLLPADRMLRELRYSSPSRR